MYELFPPQMEIFMTFLRFVYRQLTERDVKEWPRKNELFGVVGGQPQMTKRKGDGVEFIYFDSLWHPAENNGKLIIEMYSRLYSSLSVCKSQMMKSGRKIMLNGP